MKIAIDARMYGLENGGIGRYIVNIVEELQKIDQDNEYKLLLRKEHFNSLKLTNSRWEKVLAEAKHYTVREQWLVANILKKLSPDLVHFPHLNVPFMYKGKFVVTIHDLLMNKRTGAAATTLPLFVYLFKRQAYKYVFNNAINKSEKIIVPTKYVKSEVIKHYKNSEKKLEVIYEGVDRKVFEKSNITGLLRKMNIEKPYFLYVGNVYPHKNVERAVEAIATLRTKSEKKASLVIVTSRNVFQERLNGYVVKHNAESRVRFTGHLSDTELSYLYKQATAFVYPSREEGFGLPGLEAMANKTLVIASDIPVFKEVYKDNVIYFNPLDFSSIQKAMQEALEIKRDEKNEIVARAHEFAKTYTWEKTAKETLGIYNNFK